MKKGPFILFRVLGMLIMLGLIVGAGAFAYKAGMAQGISQAPAVATAIAQAAENGQAAPPMVYSHGFAPYGYGLHGHGHFGFFPFGAICGSIFFLFIFFGFMKMMFFGRMRRGWGHHGHRGPWGKDWEGGAPSMFNEWHKRAHGETPTEGEKPAEDKQSE
ncbi:hypothetical protein [Candidatus Villigracilis affinis]|uniref:hypothetical protein n=1 Tax=Candidatus Villigracilis affinis TaxID=3140682 RepID=UPI001D729B4B|nr:hypothetical protein [Anaerolineales bacterium]